MLTLKNGRYEQMQEWTDTAYGREAAFWDTHDCKEVVVKEFTTLRYPASTMTSDGRVLAPLLRAKDRVDHISARMKRIYARVNGLAGLGAHVAAPTDFFRDDLYLYEVTDVIDKENWRGCEVHEHLTAEQVDKLILDLAHALQMLHAAGILYGDVKPESICIAKDGHGGYTGMLSNFSGCVMMDNVPASDEIVCTPEYMSPELGVYRQLEGEEPPLPLEAASDVFSLGLVYHEYISGEFPKFSEEYSQLYAALVQGEPIELSKKLDPARRKLIGCMLTAEPGERMQTCADVADEIVRMHCG